MDKIGQGGAAISGLRGMGGIGKTALARKLAQELTPQYPDAQIELDLKGLDAQPLSPAQAMAHVIRAYRPEARLPETEGELTGLYRTVLHGQRALLLLDNAASTQQVLPLLPPQGCLLLVTSRQRFDLPGLFALDLDSLPPQEARQLLLTIAPRIGGEAGAIAKLCGHLPLALRVAASAVKVRVDLTPAEYRRRLEEARAMFPEVDASLGLSYALLAPEQQRRWRTLAVFPGAFHHASAAAVWELEPDPAQDNLGALLAYSLVEWDPERQRYRLHDLARLYADSRLAEEERAITHGRHAAHFRDVLGLANDLYLEGGDRLVQGLALFDLEWGNIQAGQDWAAEVAQEDDRAEELCSTYPNAGAHVLDLRLHPRNNIRWLETALAAARRLGYRHVQGNHLGNLGSAYAHLGEPRRAVEYYQLQLVITREIGDRRGEGAALGNLGIAYTQLGEPRRAIEHHQQAMAIHREMSDRRGEGNALGNLGLAYAALGEPRRAIQHYEQALAIHREVGDQRGEGAALGNLGLAYAALGEPRRAIDYYEQHLAIAREIGDRSGQGNALGNLGSAYADLEEPRRAIDYYQQHLSIARETGDRRGEGTALGNLGIVYRELGEPHRAIEFSEQHLSIAREIGDRRGEGTALWNTALALERQGNRPNAIANAEAVHRIFEEIEDPNVAMVQEVLARWRGQGESPPS